MAGVPAKRLMQVGSPSPHVSAWQVMVHPPHERDTLDGNWPMALATGSCLSTHCALETIPWAFYYKHQANLHLEGDT